MFGGGLVDSNCSGNQLSRAYYCRVAVSMITVSKGTTFCCNESDSDFLTIWKLVILQMGSFAAVVIQFSFMLKRTHSCSYGTKNVN